MAERYGRTTKILRYYWREIYFETTRRFGIWAKENGELDVQLANLKYQSKYESIEKEVINEIKDLHEHTPKYDFQETSQQEILSQHNVEVININGAYIKQQTGKVKLLKDGEVFGVEEYNSEYFLKRGYQVIFTESVPFHALFGVYMWILIQTTDEKNRMVGFGDRHAFDKGMSGEMVWTLLPEDFATKGYGERRSHAIQKHLLSLPKDKMNLLWTFDYWIEPSSDLRQYLWAHRQKDIETARKIVEILPIDAIMRVLEYLVKDYWDRFCGWPDLLVYNSSEYFFVEVKSSGDKLSSDQKNWIKGNYHHLHLPFKLVKIHRSSVISLDEINNDK
ncbi:VRR-NUC domain-containing protein [Paenibacillus elgii]